jgi:hypothetical protein
VGVDTITIVIVSTEEIDSKRGEKGELSRLRTPLTNTTNICNFNQKENVNLGWAKHIPNFTENGQK